MNKRSLDLGLTGWTVHTVSETYGDSTLGIARMGVLGPQNNGRISVGNVREPATGQSGLTANQLLDLAGKQIVSAVADHDGTLRLRFSHDIRLTVHAHPDVEAWELARDDGSLVFCMPGGCIASFRAR